MRKLSEIKDEVAREKGFFNWQDYYSLVFVSEESIDEVAKRYAQEALTEATDKAQLKLIDTHSNKSKIIDKYNLNFRDKIIVDKVSITNIELL